MKIGILGAGNIGGNLGRRWAQGGHAIKFGVRRPDEIAALVQACGAQASAGDAKAAAEFGDVVVVAVPWGAVKDVVGSLGELRGKIVVDATNPLTWKDGPVHAVATSGVRRLIEPVDWLVNTTPNVRVSELSSSRFGLPPERDGRKFSGWRR